MLNRRRLTRGAYALALAFALALALPAAAQDREALARKGQEAYSRKQYTESAAAYAAAVKAGAQDVTTLYNAACSYALAGNKDEAFNYIEAAIKKGWFNVEHLLKDTDLDSLHGAPRWQALVDRCAANAKAQKTLWGSAAFKTPYRENISDEEKVAGLSRFWSEVKYNFAYFSRVPDLDWDALYMEYLPRVRQTKSTAEYYKVLMQMCARLKDGHTNVMPPDALDEELNSKPLINTRLVEGRVMITGVYDDRLKAAGIKAGAEVVEVNGLPVKQYADERVAPYQSAATPQDMDTLKYTYGLLSGPSKEPVELTLKTESGETFKRTLARVAPKERNALLPSPPPMEFKMLPGNIAYVALNTFGSNKAAEMFEAAFSEIARSDALILDVRYNGGGDDGVGYRVLATLTDKPFDTMRWATRDYRPSFRAWGRVQGEFEGAGNYPASGSRLYTKPVVVLTGPRTYSAAEDFCVAFHSMKRGAIIGEATGGSTGQPLYFSLPGGGTGRVCTLVCTYPDGKEFVGTGVEPDRPVAPTVADLRAGRDTVLEAAVAELNKMIKWPSTAQH